LKESGSPALAKYKKLVCVQPVKPVMENNSKKTAGSQKDFITCTLNRSKQRAKLKP
jgi:hypothetical protein